MLCMSLAVKLKPNHEGFYTPKGTQCSFSVRFSILQLTPLPALRVGVEVCV